VCSNTATATFNNPVSYYGDYQKRKPGEVLYCSWGVLTPPLPAGEGVEYFLSQAVLKQKFLQAGCRSCSQPTTSNKTLKE